MQDKPHSTNPCTGYYGKCLDVKIINECNGNCEFCIERGGYEPQRAGVKEMISATNALPDYKKILILGGEPMLYPYLLEYVKGIYTPDREIFITTNGTVGQAKVWEALAPYLKAVNFSIHAPTEEENSEILGTPFILGRVFAAASILNRARVGVRINTNLMKGHIDTWQRAQDMISLAVGIGANEIRFAELQNSPGLWVDSRAIFGDLAYEDPFVSGCDHLLRINVPIRVRLRQTCGFVNPLLPKPNYFGDSHSQTKVLYPNAEVTDGWIGRPSESFGKEKIGREKNSFGNSF